MTFPARWQYSLQYLLSGAGGQLQPGWAHLASVWAMGQLLDVGQCKACSPASHADICLLVGLDAPGSLQT